MSAVPSQMDIASEVRAETDRYLASFGLTPDKLRAIQSGLSEQEVRFLPEVSFVSPRRDLPTVDIDVTVTLPDGFKGYATLDVWGRFHKATFGQREAGIPLEPDTPAYFEVDRVCWGTDEITGSLGNDLMDGIADYMLRNYCAVGGSAE